MFNLLRKYKVALVFIPLAVYWLVLFVLTSLPASKLPETNINDKVEHYIAFCVLSILLTLTFQFQKRIAALYKRPYLFSILLVAFYGMVDELHQSFIPGRFCDAKDWMADVLGGLAGIAIVLLIKRISKETVIN